MASVIVGDDLIFSLHNITMMLEELNFDVTGKCTNAVDVVRLFRQARPDLVIMDVKGMNGFYDEEQREITTFDAVELIRQIDSDVHIIIITATPEAQYVRSALKQNVDGMLVKGFKKEKLVETLQKIGLMKDTYKNQQDGDKTDE
jgi:two-component system chemotaxis response regulator CheY